MESEDSILKKSYDFCKLLAVVINNFPRNQRYILGAHIQELSLKTFELFVEAFYSPKSDKLPILKKANLEIEKMRFLIRMGYELKYYNLSMYEQLTQKLLEIGKMSGGWAKSLKS